MDILSPVDAEIYSLGLKEGIVTTSKVSQAITRLSPSSAGARLKKLSKDGYFVSTPHEGKNVRTGKTHPIKYRVVPPENALQEIFNGHKQLYDATQRIREPQEIKAEDGSPDEDIWVAKSQKLAINEGVRVLEGAKTSIEIFARDCTWLTVLRVTDTLQECHGNGIRVNVIASHPPTKNPVPEIRIKRSRQDMSVTPFCLVDRTTLMIPYHVGAFQSEYGLMIMSNPYIASGFSQLFQSLSSSPNETGTKTK